VARARAFAKKLNDAPLAIVDKRRSAHNVSEVMNLIGDVRGKVAVLVDDMIDTAGELGKRLNGRAVGVVGVAGCCMGALLMAW
jgi:phosphoribosylpyrophosphate synthetase